MHNYEFFAFFLGDRCIVMVSNIILATKMLWWTWKAKEDIINVILKITWLIVFLIVLADHSVTTKITEIPLNVMQFE